MPTDRTGYLWDAAFLGHDVSRVSAERPERVVGLEPSELRLDPGALAIVGCNPQLGLPWVRRVHEHGYVEEVRTAHASGLKALDPNRETQVGPDSFDVAVRAAAGAVTLAGAVARGELRNGFAALRPPGAQARAFYTRGCCIFNNVAIAARYVREIARCERVLILDWDVHPADGTMEIFYDDPDVHVVSLHQDGIFSKQVGTREQRGRDAGEGATWNVPVPARTGGTDALRALEPVLEEAAARCRPDFVLVSCGFDAHRADPVGNLSLVESDFVALTRLARELAETYADGRLVSVLEGGYQPRVLARCVEQHLMALMD